MLVALLALHALVGVGIFGGGQRLGRRGLLIALIAPLLTLAYAITVAGRVVDGRMVSQTISWVPSLGVDGAFRLDGFSLVMVLAVASVGAAVLVYSWFYFKSDDDTIARFAGLVILFAGAMLGVVLADDLITLFTSWELTSITSYLLIGNRHREVQARAAALQALLVTSMGGLVMLAGMVLIGQAAGTYRLSQILANPPSGTTVTAGLVCVCIGAFTKSAQYPFHSWLPGAMAAPTPVSAYLHSATMVKAGVYLIGRFAPAFATVAPWRPLVISVGMLTMVAGALRALRQYDLKLLLAHGTVSQLGFLVVLFGVGTPAATQAGVVMLIAHVLFKAALFMVVGLIDHHSGTRDIRALPVLSGRRWRAVKIVAALSAGSMAGIPLLAGFIGKEAALDALVHGHFTANGLVVGFAVIASAITFAYSARFLWGAFRLPQRLREGVETVVVPLDAKQEDEAIPPTAGLLTPAAVLTVATVLIGVAPALLDRLVGAATRSLAPNAGAAHLAIWHGLNTALWLSIVVFAVGAVIFTVRSRVARLLRHGSVIPSASEAYQRTISGLNTLSTRVTGVVQNGSLPIYLGVIVVTATVAPTIALLAHFDWPGWPALTTSGAQWPISALILGAAFAAAITRRRFVAVLFLSAVGYGMAAFFVVRGAPDLALTQAAVETVSTVLFVLVLRRLPNRFERRSTVFTRGMRIAAAAVVGTAVFIFAIVASGARTAAPVSTEMIERSLPDGHGRNVVNVILVDFRGLDTLGEISVLTAAAIGTVAIARSGRRRYAGRIKPRLEPEVIGE